MADSDQTKPQLASSDVTRTSAELGKALELGGTAPGSPFASPPHQDATQTLNQSCSQEGQEPRLDRQVLHPGKLIGGEDGKRFQLVEQIGTGAMGVVFLAMDRLLDRTVAIKFIIPRNKQMAHSLITDMVKTEARATARLSHENIVRIFDVAAYEGIPFQVMEYLEGELLHTAMAHGEFDILRATRIIIDITRGLAHAHKYGVIHRDLKPTNIFLVKGGRAKILDLGLAQIAVGLASHEHPLPGISGTPLYMAPEQWRGAAQDGRTDIWSVGIIFFEMLTGEHPFPSGHSVEERRAQILGPAPGTLLRSLRPELPAEAERIIVRAINKDPGQRYGSAEELLDELVGLEVALTHNLRTAPHAPSRQQRPTRARTERRQLTLLSCVLSDVVALSERLTLDDYSELLASFFESCSTIIRQLEGTLISSVGGRVVACFGYPIAHEDDTPRALRAALLIRDSIPSQSGGQALHAVQIGIHTGISLITEPPSSSPGAPPFIHGEVPHVASWLEGKAGRGELLVSHATQVLTRGLFEVQALGAEAPGDRPLELYRVLRPRNVSSRFERSATGLTPLVGRTSEVEKIQALWELARQGQGQFLLLSGEAGIGKSRIMELIKARVADESGTWVGCQCWPQFYNSALYPVGYGLQRLMELGPEMPALDKLARLEALLSPLGLPCAEHVPLLASLLSIPLSGRYTQPALSPEAYKRGLLASLSSVLLALAAQKPTLLLVEDVHWSDGLTLELLDSVFHQMAATKLLIVLSFRPDFQPQWTERAHLRRILLQRLSPEETTAMVVLSLGGQTLPEKLLEKVVHRTDGIPLFIEELARVVSDSWSARFTNEVAAGKSFSEQVIPSTLHELLLSRLDKLTAESREVAQLGAVIGREFTYPLIQRASHLEDEVLRRSLMQVIDSGLLRYHGQKPDAKYSFKHALVQDAAYQSLDKGERKLHHQRVARALMQHFPAVAEAQPELVAHHHLAGGDSEQAILWLERAGQRAVQRSAHIDAVAHYSRGLQLLKTMPAGPRRDRQELLLQLAYGAPLMSTRGYAAPEVHETYARARELCRLVGDDAQLFPAVLGLWHFYMVRGDLKISVELGRQLLAQAESTQEPVMLMLAYRSLGTSLLLSGDMLSCRDYTERGLLLYNREQHGHLMLRYGQDPGVSSGLYAAWALWFLGYVDQSLRRAQDALELARALKHPLSIAFALTYLATVHNYRSEHATAYGLAEEAMAISAEHGLALWYAMSKIQRGWALLARGEAAGAEVLKEGVTGWKSTGAATGLTFFLSALIWSQWQSGHLDEAMQTLQEMEEIVVTKDEHFFEAELLRLRGEVTLASGAGEPLAERCFLRGLEVARAQQAKSWELRLCTSLGSLLKKQGRIAEARQLLEPVCNWFTEGLGTEDFKRARDLLAGLGGNA